MDNTESDNLKDRELGMHAPITRRDFLNGVAIGLGGALAGAFNTTGTDVWARQQATGDYPPALTGMRGSHEGSYDAAHALRDGTFWKDAGPATDTGERYDLVVVGGGISGLAAAYFYRARVSRSAKILLLDNHDDFGGHARRNEFNPRGRLLITNAGTAGIESPFAFSPEARALFEELGIDPPALAAAAGRARDQRVFEGLRPAYFFDKASFGVDRLVTAMPSSGRAEDAGAAALSKWTSFLSKTPLSADARRDILRLETQSVDYMPGIAANAKKERLAKISYRDYLLEVAKVHADVVPFYQTRTHGLYGVGIDAVPALDCWVYRYPGFQGLGLDPGPSAGMTYTALGDATPKEPYEFHFPDGNASVARMLVRALIPRAISGPSAEDIVTARMDYSRLDMADAPIRLRLNSTVVRAKNIGGPSAATGVEVTYARERKAFSVRANAVVMACWNMVIPYLCPELAEAQKKALRYGVKVPLVYTAVAIGNWTAFHRLGISRVSSPGMYHTSVSLEQPTTIGSYKATPRSADDPLVVRMLRTPCRPGLPARDQHRAGHADLLATPFTTFERNIRDQLARILGEGGFDPARDIEAITVNRWPHGYTYEYNPLWDPEWPAGQRPCEVGRRRFGRIAIANADAGAAAYTDGAIDQAHRAVVELLAVL